MSKQIYIDKNGNEIQVSGTVNTADMMPMSGNDSTKVSEAIGDLSDLTTSVKSSLVGAVNEAREWTMLGNYSGNDSADISSIFSTANEIKIVARTYTSGQVGSSQVYSVIATRKEIIDFMWGGFTELHYIQGINNGQQNVIDFGISNTAIRIATFILNGSDVKSSNTGFRVYYR